MSAWCIYALFFVVYLERLSCCVRVGNQGWGSARIRPAGHQEMSQRGCLLLRITQTELALGSWLLAPLFAGCVFWCVCPGVCYYTCATHC